MLLLSQNAVEMWIGIFAPLNVETAANVRKHLISRKCAYFVTVCIFLQIVQSVFGYYTMMISFLEE